MPWPRQKARQPLTERQTRSAHFAGGSRRQVLSNKVSVIVVIIVAAIFAIRFAATGFAGFRDWAVCQAQGHQVSPARLHGGESLSFRSSRPYTDRHRQSPTAPSAQFFQRLQGTWR
jgi:hypothetical protein